MGLFDKLKDLFMDEIVDEDEVELEEENKKIYEEPKNALPKVMRDTIKKEESGINFEELKPVKKEEEKQPEEKKFTFPVDFEDNLPPSRVANKNVLDISNEVNKRETLKKEVVKKEEPKKTVELYQGKKEVVVEKHKFKPTPVISPVYGVLDKNYRKEEVREKDEETVEMKRPSKKVDFETVRKKAFGNLTDDIKDNLMCENCELYKEAKKISAISQDNLLYDMTVDEKPEEPITIEKAIDNYEDFGVAYEPNTHNLKQEETPIMNNTTIINNNTDVLIADKIEIEEEKKNKEVDYSKEVENEETVKIPSREESKKENKVDEDFFQLIDSMYKERIDG